MSDRKPFMSGCPFPGCPKQNTMIRWVHSNCGGYRWIYDDGYYNVRNVMREVN